MPFSLFLALKYLRPKRSFISIVTLLSVIGVVLGVAILIIVLSIMVGFGDMWKEKILGFNAHLAVMGFDEQTRQMFLRGCFPGVGTDEVLTNMGFAVDTSRAEPIAPPSAQELAILRDKCDPQRLILG